MEYPTLLQYGLLLLGGLTIGFSKSGFAGVGLIQVLAFAEVFGGLPSTGVLLPLLIIGDLCAIQFFGRVVVWSHFWRLLPPTCIGLLLGVACMRLLEPNLIQAIIGGIILFLSILQLRRILRPRETTPMDRGNPLGLAIGLGILAGFTTMVANAAGPVVALFFLAIGLPKFEFVGTSAWFFLIVNCIKIPLSTAQNLITLQTLFISLPVIPAIPTGMYLGRWCLERIPQQSFNVVVLIFAALASVRLIVNA